MVDAGQDPFQTIGYRRATQREILQMFQLSEDSAELFQIILIETKIDEITREIQCMQLS